MKKIALKITSFVLCLAAAVSPLVGQPTPLVGDHEVVPDGDTGSLSVAGDVSASTAQIMDSLSLGVTSSMPAIYFDYDDMSASMILSAEENGVEYVWVHNLAGTSGVGKFKMVLDASNKLTLYDNGSPENAVIELSPEAGNSYISINGQPVLVQGTGGEAYLTQDESDLLYLPSGASLGLFGGTAANTGSFVMGSGNTSVADGQVLVGDYSRPEADTAFAVGNGVDQATSANAFSVSQEGDARVGRDLYVSRNASVYGGLRVAPAGDLSMGAFTSSGVYDADAQAYFDRMAAEGGVDLSLETRDIVDSFVRALKEAPDPVWDEIHALWIFVGNSEESCALDLRNSLNPYDITWSGPAGLTFDVNGVRGDGTGYGNTGFSPSVSAVNTDYGLTVSVTRPTSGGNKFAIGSTLSNEQSGYCIRLDAGTHYQIMAGRNHSLGSYTGYTPGNGTMTMSIHNETLRAIFNGVELVNVSDYTPPNSFPSNTVNVLRLNSQVAQDWNFGDGILKVAAIHQGLTLEQIAAFQGAIVQLEADLGR